MKAANFSRKKRKGGEMERLMDIENTFMKYRKRHGRCGRRGERGFMNIDNSYMI